MILNTVGVFEPEHPRISGENSPQKEIAMERIAQEIEETEQLAHLSATHSNALVENPFD